MIDAINPALDERPKALNGVRVNEATGISLGRVLNRLVGVAELLDKVVASEFIRVDRGVDVSRHLLPENRQQSPSLDVRHDLGCYRTTALNYADHGSLTIQAPATLSTFLAAEVGLVNLHTTKHRLLSLSHDSPDLVEHAPSRLVGHTDLSLELLGRDTAASRGNQEEGMKPTPQGRGAVVEDGVCRGADLSATELTAVGFPSLDPVVLSDLLALGAEDTLRPSGVHQKLKTGMVIRELVVKLLQRIYRGLSHLRTSLSNFQKTITVGVIHGVGCLETYRQHAECAFRHFRYSKWPHTSFLVFPAEITIRELTIRGTALSYDAPVMLIPLQFHRVSSLSKKEYSTICTCCQGIVTF